MKWLRSREETITVGRNLDLGLVIALALSSIIWGLALLVIVLLG